MSIGCIIFKACFLKQLPGIWHFESQKVVPISYNISSQCLFKTGRLPFELFKVIVGLLTVLAGFEILYAAVESSALVTALLVVVNLGLALAGAFFMNVNQEKPS